MSIQHVDKKQDLKNYSELVERQQRTFNPKTVVLEEEIDEKEDAKRFNAAMEMLNNKFGKPEESELIPMKITQNEGNLFLCVRYAVDCRACRTIRICENENTDSPDFAQELHKLGWESQDGETAICPTCIDYFAKLNIFDF